MMGKKAAGKKLFYQFNLEERVPAHHLLRRVTEAVDFSFVRRQTARFYSHTGQPSVDPIVLFKMAVLGYLYNLPSERRLVEEIGLNLAYRWFVGYDLDEAIPDHSVLSKARQRFGPTVYLRFFTEVVRQCEKAGLIKGNLLYVDSTLVPANADADRVGSRALLSQLPDVGEHVTRVFSANVEPGDPPDPAATPMPLRVIAPPAPPEEPPDAPLPDALPPIVRPTAPRPDSPPPDSLAPPLHVVGPADPPNQTIVSRNERMVSRTDPDAEVVQRGGVIADLYYKVHTGVDGGHARIVTAVEVTGGTVADEHLLARVVTEHEGTTGRTVQEVAADAKYGTIENYQYLARRGIAAAIPLHGNSATNRAVPADAFHYEPARDLFRCPGGNLLRRQGVLSHTAAHPLIVYRAKPKECAVCPLKARCCGEAEARTITRPDDGGLRERTLAYLATPHARLRIRQRKVWIETIFGDGKERRGLRRARFRGVDRVRIQAYLIAIAQNVRQLAKGHASGPLAAAARQEGEVLARLSAGSPSVSPAIPPTYPPTYHKVTTWLSLN